MKIIVKRPFSSSKSGVGNTSEGQVLDTDDAYARMLINAGLAAEYAASPALKAEKQTSFIKPVGANVKSGSSLQAAQALQERTARKSKNGVMRIQGAVSSL